MPSVLCQAMLHYCSRGLHHSLQYGRNYRIDLASNACLEFMHSLFLSDEAYFTLDWPVNKQNTRYLAKENPEMMYPLPLCSKRVTVWCGLTSQHVTGPYSYEDSSGNAVTVNAERYNEILEDFVYPIVSQKGINEFYLQQYGAPCHTARSACYGVVTLQ